MKEKTYEKPSLEVVEMELTSAILDVSKPGGQGQDIPWGAPDKKPFGFGFGF